jgi:20S proteasome alpha/beta subunit
LFFIAVYPAGTQIYTTSPSGIYRSFKAYALGSGEAKAREYLSENYKADMPFEDLIRISLKTLKESIDEEINKENARLAYVKTEDKTFHECTKDEIETFISKQ